MGDVGLGPRVVEPTLPRPTAPTPLPADAGAGTAMAGVGAAPATSPGAAAEAGGLGGAVEEAAEGAELVTMIR